MKNVTITLDEDVALWARIEAARRDKSVSRFISEALQAARDREDAYQRAFREWECLEDLDVGTEGAPLPKREELYDRPILR